VKFLVVSTVAFVVVYVLVVAGVHWTSLDKILINAIANILVIPVNFLGQKLWSFKK
jgi:putative flippase GtrA